MMKIGIVTTWFERGAAYVSKAYEQILEKEFEIVIYARGGEEFGEKEDFWNSKNVYWGKRIHTGIPSYIVRKDFKLWLGKEKPDILLFNEQHSWDILLYARKLGITIGAYIDYYTDKTVKLFHIYDFLICNTLRHYSVFEHHPQCYYIPWGTDLIVFQPQKREENQDNITFFHSCGFSPYRKGTDLLLKAFNLIEGNVKLIIHSQGKLKIDVPQSILNNPRIEIIEGKAGAPGLYYKGDVYVYPSRLEGIGLTLIEALACGLPVITTDHPPMNEFIQNQNYGLLVPVVKQWKRDDQYFWDMVECDVVKLKESMQYYIDNQNNLMISKEFARIKAQNDLNWENNASILIDIFKNINSLSVPKKLLTQINFYEYTHYPIYAIKAIKRKLFTMIKRKTNKINRGP